MIETPESTSAAYGPWNPGISSALPPALLPLATILRPEHVYTSFSEAQELHQFSGLPFEDVVLFRPRRLAVHELLIRITADLSVPDGPRQEDLGINFRRMAETLFVRHLAPHMAEIEREYGGVQNTIGAVIKEASATACAPSLSSAPPLRALGMILGFGARADSGGAHEAWMHEDRVVRGWIQAAEHAESPPVRTALLALARVASALRIRHAAIRLDHPLVQYLATTIACNGYGSEAIGRMIAPLMREAARKEGFRLLPAQSRPVVMNTKGASASGKSTMRPLQQTLAGSIGADWGHFALISPDIWRKYLLDYDTLGSAYKYAGTFTGLEMEVVHHKLDRYMAEKAERGEMPHLLIDRFRFDSFAPESDEAGSNLLTRFGHFVYLFFMITPPHATVERAWARGLQVGRYKAVDDLLAHNVEAYSGMPELFFTWALRRGKRVHYEFLDNSVPLGERPRTVAFGWNGEMNVLDVKCLIDVDRYRKINIDATDAAGVYPRGDLMAPQMNASFLAACARRLPSVNFVERDTGCIYLRLESGAIAWADRERLQRACVAPETRAGIDAVAPSAREAPHPPAKACTVLDGRAFHTLGRWGGEPVR